MGSLRPKASLLSDAAIVSRYQAGESVGLLSLRCRVPDYHVVSVLAASGTRIRGPAEALRLAMKSRGAWPSTRRLNDRMSNRMKRA